MRILIFAMLCMMAVALLGFAVSLVAYFLGKHKEKDWEATQITMCLRTREAKRCKKDCSSCAWGVGRKTNIVEFKK